MLSTSRAEEVEVNVSVSALLIASLQCDEDSSFSLCVGSALSFVLLRKLFAPVIVLALHGELNCDSRGASATSAEGSS